MNHPDLKITFFEKINTKEKAYWLGLLYADGYINKNGYSFSLDLSQKDICLIYNFCDAIGANKSKIKTRIHQKGYLSNKIVIHSKKMVNDLFILGCTNNKSKTIKLLEFKNESLNLAFLMGYYDGDGSANSTDICSGSIEFLDAIKQKYNLKYTITKRSVYRLNLGAKLKRKMLENYPNSLPRKKLLYNGDKSYKTNKLTYQKRKVERPPLNILIDLIANKSYVEIGRQFGVSDNAVRKWFKYYGVNAPKKQKGS